MASSNIDWRTFGGNRNYEKNNNVNFNNLTTDNLIIKNPYNGLFTISGELVVYKNSTFNSNITIIGNTSIRKNIDISGNLHVVNNALFDGDVIVSGALNLLDDVTFGNSLYVNEYIYIGDKSFIKTNQLNLGVNVMNPTATIDVAGDTINTLKMSSTEQDNVNIISINCENDGITVLTDFSKNAIQFWNKNKIPFNTTVDNIKSLNNDIILNNLDEDASITYYKLGGNITIDCPNNTYINSNITIGGGESGTTISHLLNETALITDVCFNKYLYNYFEVPSSQYQTGNALTLVSGSFTDIPSNVGLNLVTKQNKGITLNGGEYIKDSTRSFGTISVFDVCGATYPVQMTVSGNDPRYLKATTGFNTLVPQTEKYAMCVNGPIKITNDEIQPIMDVSFQINCVVNSSVLPLNIIVAGGINFFGNHSILYSINGGISWLNATYNYNLQSNTTFLFNNGFIYNFNYSFLTGSDSVALFSYDGNASWNNILTGIDADFTDVLVLPQSINKNILILLSSTNGNVYWFIAKDLNTIKTKTINGNGIYTPPNSSTSDFTIINTLTTPLSNIKCMGAISAVDEIGILYGAGNNGIFCYKINNLKTITSINTLFYDVKTYTENSYSTMDISNNFAVFAGNNIITYTTTAKDGIGLIHCNNITGNINKIKIAMNECVIAVGDNGKIYYSKDKCVSWGSIIPNNYGIKNILTNRLSSIVMPDNNSFLISSIYSPYSSNTNTGRSKLFFCHWPVLFNNANNNVLDICGNMNIDGSVLINDGVNIIKTLYVNGDVSMNSNLDIKKKLKVTGDVELQNISIHGETTYYGNVTQNQDTIITSTTNSTSTITGSSVFFGGIGIAGNLFMGGNLNVANNSYLTSSSVSSNSKTGALVVTGGVGIGGNINIENEINVTGNLNVKGIGTSYIGNLLNPIHSISESTGAVVVYGGVGTGGNINIGGNAKVRYVMSINGGVESTNVSSGTLKVTGGVGVTGNTYIGGNLFITSTTPSTTSNTGSLQVSGGVGVAGDIYNNGKIINKSVSESYSEDTGAVIVDNGGLGVSGNIFSGKGVFIKGIDSNYTLAGESYTGSLQVLNGGAWIKGNIITKSNILVDQNVGIGTSTPAYSLDVNGDCKIRSNYHLYFNNSNNNIYGDTNNLYFNVNGGAVSHKFNVTDGTSGGTVATINKVGVGIKTIDPKWDLDVSGNGRVTGNLYLDNSSNNYIYSDFSNVYFNVSGGRHKFNITGVADGGTVATINKYGLGIRTNDPKWELDVSGNGRVTGNLYLDNSSNNYIYSDFSNVYFNVSGGRHKFNITGVADGGTVATINKYGLGIRTNDPKWDLDVSGNGRVTGNLYLDNSSNNYIYSDRLNVYYNVSGGHIFNKALNITNNNFTNENQIQFTKGSKIYTIQQVDKSPDDYFRMGRNGFGDIVINSTGNVGIGTESPSYNLDVVGNARIANNILINAGSTSNNLYFVNNTTGNFLNNIISRIFTTGTNLYFDYYNNITFRYASLLTNNISTTGTQICFTNTNSSASIGIGVINPSYALDVSGSGRFTNSIIIEKNITQTSLTDTTLLKINNTDNTIVQNAIQYSSIALTSQDTGAIIRGVHTKGVGGGFSIWITYPQIEVLSIISSGNVGIKNTSPLYELDITGSARVSNTFYANTVSLNNSCTFNSNSINGIYYNSNSKHTWNVNTNEKMSLDATGLSIFNGSSSQFLKLFTNNSSSNYTTLFFNQITGFCIETPRDFSTINLGNSTNNNTAVNVNGNLYVKKSIQSTEYNSQDIFGNYRFRIDFGTCPYIGSNFDNIYTSVHMYSVNFFYWYYNPGGVDGTGSPVRPAGWCMKLDNNGNLYSTAFYSSSDYRIKENVVNLKETNYTVDNLRPVHYYNKNTNKEDIGFIAHEVQEDFPFLVSGEKDGKENQSLNYTGLIGVLVKEIQDLKSEKAKQDALIQSLIQRMNTFELTQLS